MSLRVPLTAEEIRRESSTLGADPREILRWTCAQGGTVGLTCSFGGTGIVLAHMVAVLSLPIPVYFLDTGFLFEETIRYRREFAERYRLRVIDVQPLLSVDEQAAEYGDALYGLDPDQCCQLRKVESMRRILSSLDIWVSGLRRDQSETRSEARVLERHIVDDGRTILKVNPLAHWTRDEAQRYIREHELPENPLLAQGYKSLGCWPCTQKVAADAPERAGRWAGTRKTECGLHTFTQKADEGAV